MSIEIGDGGLGYVYLGDTLIAGGGGGGGESGWEYTYDFAGKTTTQIYNDGWERQGGTVNCDSNGLYGSSARISIAMPGNYSNAKRITFHFLGKIGNSGSQDITFSTTQSKTSETNILGVYQTYGTNGCNLILGGTNNNFTNTVNGTVEFDMVADLVEKIAYIRFKQGTTNLFSFGITDAQITNILTNGYIMMFINGTTPRCTSLSVKVEE